MASTPFGHASDSCGKGAAFPVRQQFSGPGPAQEPEPRPLFRPSPVPGHQLPGGIIQHQGASIGVAAVIPLTPAAVCADRYRRKCVRTFLNSGGK